MPNMISYHVSGEREIQYVGENFNTILNLLFLLHQYSRVLKHHGKENQTALCNNVNLSLLKPLLLVIILSLKNPSLFLRIIIVWVGGIIVINAMYKWQCMGYSHLAIQIIYYVQGRLYTLTSAWSVFLLAHC